MRRWLPYELLLVAIVLGFQAILVLAFVVLGMC